MGLGKAREQTLCTEEQLLQWLAVGKEGLAFNVETVSTNGLIACEESR